MAKPTYQSWGRYPNAHQNVVYAEIRHQQLPIHTASDSTYLPYGNGRSYGDVCLNDGGTLIDVRGLDHFIAFDLEAGTLRCEAGVLLADILKLIVPRGWFLPVTPGTQFVTVGGAIANDVHGKNHHRKGTFGRFVNSFELVRSDGSRLLCSAQENPDWFSATVGGLGLTGMIAWAEIQLVSLDSAFIDQQSIRCNNLDDFFSWSSSSNDQYEYTVGWVDCLAKGHDIGRGVFYRANNAPALPNDMDTKWVGKNKLSVPFEVPFSLFNNMSISMFNKYYFHSNAAEMVAKRVHYQTFFYPLDRLLKWNLVYGKRGFLQYQCVVPKTNEREAIKEILQIISAEGAGSFLAVLKQFGDLESPGILSFPRPGTTLALDFPNNGAPTFKLLRYLDEVVKAANGAIYPAKDARMDVDTFRQSFPQWESIMPFVDPYFSSSFWRRINGHNV